MKFTKRDGWVVWLWCVFALLYLLAAGAKPAFADGGAPNLAYVAGAADGIAVIDIAQQHLTGSLAVGGDPHMLLLSLDGRFLYVTQPALGRVAILSAKSGATLCTASLPGQPTLLALGPQSGALYAAGNGASKVTALDATTCAVQRTFEAGSPVYGLAVGLVGAGNDLHDQLWVAGSTSLTSFDQQGQYLGSIPVAGGPQYISWPGGYTLYVTTRRGGVDAADVGTHQVTPLLSGGQFGPMDYDALTGEVYVPDASHRQLEVLTPLVPGSDAIPHEPARIIPLSGTPQAVAITSDGQLGFVALAEGKVAMLDVPGRKLVNTIDVGGTPRFIITGLYPPLLGTTPLEASTWSNVARIVALVVALGLIAGSMLLIRRNRFLHSPKKKI